MRTSLQRLQKVQQNMQLKFSYTTINEGPVLVSQINENFARVTLNKPKALNALDSEMIAILKTQIQEWNKSDNLKAIWLDGTGDKAFCAGGDIKSLYDAKVSGDKSRLPVLESFFREEFEVDYALSQMKPIQISVLDGIVMGGGVGVSIHAPIRIATEASVFAMPEAKIGFFTDVGGGYFLSRLRNNIGFYLGLTGARLKGQQLVQAGVADYFVPKTKLEELQQDLKNKIAGNFTLQEANQIVQNYSQEVPKQFQNEEEINTLFTANQYQDLYKNFEQNQSEFAQKTWKLLNSQNPLSLRIIFEQLQRARNQNQTLREAFISDYRLTQRFMEGTDFFEGVRTVLVDRNDTPQFQYKEALEVPQEEIERYFSPLTTVPELNI